MGVSVGKISTMGGGSSRVAVAVAVDVSGSEVAAATAVPAGASGSPAESRKIAQPATSSPINSRPATPPKSSTNIRLLTIQPPKKKMPGGGDEGYRHAIPALLYHKKRKAPSKMEQGFCLVYRSTNSQKEVVLRYV
jgi:hypothetical protein